MRSLIPTLLYLLSSCAVAPPPPPGVDLITWHLMETRADVEAAARREGSFLPTHADAFAVHRRPCPIYSLVPATIDELVEIWKHEGKHCREGAFHR